MPEIIDGVPACYGCIENVILSTLCLQCDHLKGCEEYSKKLKKSWNTFRRDIRRAERDNLRRAMIDTQKAGE